MRYKIVISKTYVAQFYEVNQKSKEVSVLPYTSRDSCDARENFIYVSKKLLKKKKEIKKSPF